MPRSVWDGWVKWPRASARKTLLSHLRMGNISREDYPRTRLRPQKPDKAHIDAHSKASQADGYDFRSKGVPDRELISEVENHHMDLLKQEAESVPVDTEPGVDDFVTHILSLPPDKLAALRAVLSPIDEKPTVSDFLGTLNDEELSELRAAVTPAKRRRVRRKDVVNQDDDESPIP